MCYPNAIAATTGSSDTGMSAVPFTVILPAEMTTFDVEFPTNTVLVFAVTFAPSDNAPLTAILFVNVLFPAKLCVVVSTTPLAVVLAEVSRARGTVPVERADALIPVVLVVRRTFASSRASGNVPADRVEALVPTVTPLRVIVPAVIAVLTELFPINTAVVFAITFAPRNNEVMVVYAPEIRASGIIPEETADALMPVLLVVKRTFALSRASGTVPVDRADALIPVAILVAKTLPSNKSVSIAVISSCKSFTCCD